MVIYSGNVESTLHFEAPNLEIHKMIWTVPNFLSLLDKIQTSDDIQEIQPSNQETLQNPTETSSEDNFQLNIELTKVRYSTKSMERFRAIAIVYKSKKPAFLRYFLMKMFTFNTKTWAYNEQEQCIFFKERVVVENVESGQNGQLIGCLWNKGLCKIMGFEPDGIDNTICLLNENSLRLNLQFAVITNPKLVCNIPASQLSEDWKKLFNEGLYSDAVITSSEGEEFKVHKVVLASRCAVLKAHFDHDTTETETNIVKSNQKSAVLREVLSFIYTDHAEVDKDPETLLAAADFYQLSRLKSLCEDSIRKKLTVNNAYNILQLADLHNANTLKEITQEFIKWNCVQQK